MSVPRGGIVAAVLSVEMVTIVLLYWARITAFSSDPGRFRKLEPVLASDWIVFLVAPTLAALLVGWVFSRAPGSGKIVSYGKGAVLSGLAFGAAMLIASNKWGS